ncbi:MAG TPA: lysylphosphatidylglycerol synthase domain-containing protein [Vicinamibacteria bacterium]|nr:lysylphosphatidylglycerol synthase domain-containing protein [Vicinamibacteria bacterium]
MSRRAAFRLLLLTGGLAVVGYLVHEAGPAVVWDAFRSLGWRLGLIILFPTGAAIVIDTLAWRLAFLHPPPQGLSFLVGARLAGEAVNLGTPTASVGGEPVKALLLRPRVPLREGLASVIVDKTTVVSAQVLVLAAGLSLSLGWLPLGSSLVIAMAGFLAVEVLCVAGFVVAQLGGAAGRGGRFLAKLRMAPTARGQAMLDGLDQTLRAIYAERRARLVGSGLFHFLSFAAGSLEIYLVARFLGLPVSVGAAFVIGAFGSAVKFLSFMIPASLGALEGANMVIFAAFGLGGAAGLTYTLVRRLREIAWIAAGFACLSVLSARPAPSAEPDARVRG